jgi:hypothetical protein
VASCFGERLGLPLESMTCASRQHCALTTRLSEGSTQSISQLSEVSKGDPIKVPVARHSLIHYHFCQLFFPPTSSTLELGGVDLQRVSVPCVPSSPIWPHDEEQARAVITCPSAALRLHLFLIQILPLLVKL